MLDRVECVRTLNVGGEAQISGLCDVGAVMRVGAFLVKEGVL